MQIRRLSEADDAIYEQIRLHALQDNPEAFASTFDEEFENAATRFRQRLQSNPANTVLGIFDHENEIQGMIGISRGQKLKTLHMADLWGLYVRPGFRRKGAARYLLEEAIRFLRSFPRIEQVRIGVIEGNVTAEKLCHSYGFKLYGRETRAFKLGQRYFDLDHYIYFIRQPEWAIPGPDEVEERAIPPRILH